MSVPAVMLPEVGKDSNWSEQDHPRRDDGKFGEGAGDKPAGDKPAGDKPAGDKPKKPTKDKPKDKPGESSTKDTEKDPDPNRPSRRENRKEGVEPPALAEKFKPPKPRGESKAPRNAEGRPVTGYSASGLTNTAFGDLGEAISAQLGLRSILPDGRRSNRDVAEEGSSIDTEYDHSGLAFEIKACAVEAQEYKAGPKKDELADKKRFAEKHGLKAGIMVLVTDVQAGKAWAYWKEGIDQGGKLNPEKLDEWNYMGEVTFEPPAIPKKEPS